jgi:iron(III) transport system substrate-binding protein
MPTKGIAFRIVAVATALAFAASCSRDGRTPVVVYSPHGQAMLRAFEERFEAAYPQYDLQGIDLPSQDVPNRVRAEKGNPQCDVWWGASAVTFAQAADEDLLEPYDPAWSGALPADAKDPRARWMGMYETPEVIVYNTDLVAAADAPKDWDDVLDPKWKGKILVRDPGPSDTMRTIFGAIIMREWPKTHSAEGGYAWLRRLAANTKDYPKSWEGMLTSLNRQEAALTLWNMPDIKRAVDEKGYKLAYVFPASGTPVVTDGIAVVRGAPHAEGARLFYEFVCSPESLAFAAEKFSRIPSRSDVDRATLPEWIRALTYTRVATDWATYRANIQEWMSHWSNEIQPSSGS